MTLLRVRKIAAGLRPRGWLAALLLALGGLAALRLGLTLAGTLDLSEAAPVPPPEIAGPAPEVAPPATQWLPEPAAGPEPVEAASEGMPEGDDALPLSSADLDPARLTESEIALLHQLAARRAALERREREIDQRAALVEGAAADLERQIARLAALRDEVAAVLDAHDAEEEAKLASLVKIYETMKPKAAAEIFDRLEMAVLIEVVERMREVKSADVMARMDPVKAKQVTSELARRSELLETRRAAARGASPPSGGT